jgi:hypothetical protein
VRGGEGDKCRVSWAYSAVRTIFMVVAFGNGAGVRQTTFHIYFIC